MHRFVLDFPYSDIGVSRLMPRENVECTCRALKDIFVWLGGVSERIWISYDNAAGVGGRPSWRSDDLFGRFQVHYGDETALFHAGRAALKSLSDEEFDVVRLKRMRTDEYCVAAIDGRHRYAADPADAGHEVTLSATSGSRSSM